MLDERNYTEHYFTDNLGWVDDFSAPAGVCGHPVTRKLMVMALLSEAAHSTLKQLAEQKYDPEMVKEVFSQLVEQAYEGR